MNQVNKKAIKITSVGVAALITLGSYHFVDISGHKLGPMIRHDKEISLELDEDLLEEYKNADDNLVVDLPPFAREEVNRSLGMVEDQEVNVRDLRKVKDLVLVNDDSNADLSWLNYCTNLEQLVINGEIANNMDQIIRLDNLQELSLYTRDTQIENSQKKLVFIGHCPKLETLDINGDFDPEYLSELVNVKNLIIHQSAYIHNIRDLDFVENLTIRDGQYDIAIKLSMDDINYLEGKGVNIIIDNPNFSLDDLKRVSKRLDDIAEGLNIDEKATDEEKVNEVLIYCIENLKYNPEIREKVLKDPYKPLSYEDSKLFYEKGSLYGALEREDQVCGNYTALMEALLYRVGVDSYAMYSDIHAWNLIEVDGESYYYDATWLDDDSIIYSTEEEGEELGSTIITFEEIPSEDVIRSGDPELLKQLTWYKVKPADYKANPEKYEEGQLGSHKAENYQLVIERIKDEKNKDNPAKDMYEVTIGNKKFIIAGGALFGLLAALGIVVSARKKKEAERIKKTNQFYGYNQDYDNIDYFSNDYEPFKWGK